MSLVPMTVLNNFSNIDKEHPENYSRLQALCCWKIYIFFLFLFAGETISAATGLDQHNEAISTVNILNLISGLFVVLLIFLCIAYLLKRLTGAGSISRGYIKVVDALHLGTRERLVLVKVADTYMLLGIASGSINALHILPDQLQDEISESGTDFKSKLHDLLTVAKIKNG